ncbi:hypothetical protein [Cylindrospermopsis raciborskii]|uniref:hypothetical protein n=1 Tax=Cylindrospermopsis raciborskii TaxID=77022 RepID=UPI0011468052|nr:hypothetical protein [Cylindrospermopsis raciborskii]
MNILKGDREALSVASRIALPKGDRLYTLSSSFFSREKFEHRDGRLRSTPFGRSLLEVIPRFLLKGKF